MNNKPVEINKEYVSEHGTDLCVLCKADTGIPTDMAVQYRYTYVECIGQFCNTCYKKVMD